MNIKNIKRQQAVKIYATNCFNKTAEEKFLRKCRERLSNENNSQNGRSESEVNESKISHLADESENMDFGVSNFEYDISTELPSDQSQTEKAQEQAISSDVINVMDLILNSMEQNAGQ